MRIDARDHDRQFLGRTTLKADDRPAHATLAGGEADSVALDWSEAHDSDGLLQRCPVCGCGDLFVRRDFPQRFGMALVVVAGLASVALFATDRVLWAVGVLGAVVVLDFIVMMFVRRCLVCYRCRSEFRHVPIGKPHHGYDLAIGEKYRPDVTSADDPA